MTITPQIIQALLLEAGLLTEIYADPNNRAAYIGLVTTNVPHYRQWALTTTNLRSFTIWNPNGLEQKPLPYAIEDPQFFNKTAELFKSLIINPDIWLKLGKFNV